MTARAGTDTFYYWGENSSGLCQNANTADTRALEHRKDDIGFRLVVDESASLTERR